MNNSKAWDIIEASIVLVLMAYLLLRLSERWDGWLCGVWLALLGLLLIKLARLFTRTTR